MEPDPRRCVAKVLPPDGEPIALGSAFFLSPKHLLTCYHVIEPFADRALRFQASDGIVRSATLVKEFSSPADLDDYAVLEVDRSQGWQSTSVALIDSDWVITDVVSAYGFQYENEFGFGFPATATITGSTVHRGRQLLVLEDTKHFRPGISGSPLLNLRTGAVVGMASLALVSSESTALGTAAVTVIGAHPALAALNLEAATIGATRNYRERLQHDLAALTLLHKRLPLNQVYVNLRLLKGYREATAPLSADSLTHMRRLRQFLGDSKKSANWEMEELRHLQALERRREERNELLVDIHQALAHERLVVLGNPGAGKTTLLKHLALSLAETPTQRLPILVTLNDYSRFHATTGRSLFEYIVSAVTDDEHDQPTAIRRLLHRLLAEGRCCVMLDALDEVVETSRRAQIAKDVCELAKSFKGNVWLLTSRKAGFRPDWFGDFQLLEVKELDVPGIKALVSNWFGASQKSRADSLVATLRINHRLHAFATNPLLLSFLLLVYEKGDGRLPRARTELYQNIVDLLLRWDTLSDRQSRSHHDDVSADTKKDLLGLIALDAHLQQQEILTRREWLELIKKHIDPSIDSGHLFDELCASGLIVRVSEDGWKFLHLSVQEYLAAVGLHAKAAGRVTGARWPDPDIAFLLTRFREPWWREVMVQLVSLMDEVVDSVIGRITSEAETDLGMENLVFAAECVSNSDSVSREVRATVAGKLVSAYRSAEFERIRDRIGRCLATNAIGTADGSFGDDFEQALAFEDPQTVTETVMCLSELGLSDGIQVFRKLAGHRRSSESPNSDARGAWVRAYGVRMLGRATPSEEVMNALREALLDQHQYVRLCATESLAEFANDSLIAREALCQALHDQSAVVVHAAARKIRHGEWMPDNLAVVAAIVVHARSLHWYERLEAIRALSYYADVDDTASALLAEARTDTNPWVRAASQRRFNDGLGLRLALGPLSHERSAVAVERAIGRAQVGSPGPAHSSGSAEELFRNGLEERDDSVASDAVRNLANCPVPSTSEYLRLFLLIRRTREAALEALCELATPDAVEALKAWLTPESSDWLRYDYSETRRRVVSGLATIHSPESTAVLQLVARGSFSTETREYLCDKVLDSLLGFVVDTRVGVEQRLHAVEAASLLRSASVVPVFRAALKDRALRNRAADEIAQGLARVATSNCGGSVVGAIREALEAGLEWKARVVLVKALVVLEDDFEALAALRSLFVDPDPNVRVAVAQASHLCEGDAGRGFLATLGRDKVPDVRQMAFASYLLWLTGERETQQGDEDRDVSDWSSTGPLGRTDTSARVTRSLQMVLGNVPMVQRAAPQCLIGVLRLLARHNDDGIRSKAIALQCVFDPASASRSLRRVTVKDAWRRVKPVWALRFFKLAKRLAKKSIRQWNIEDDLDWTLPFDRNHRSTSLYQEVAQELGRLPPQIVASLRISDDQYVKKALCLYESDQREDDLLISHDRLVGSFARLDSGDEKSIEALLEELERGDASIGESLPGWLQSESVGDTDANDVIAQFGSEDTDADLSRVATGENEFDAVADGDQTVSEIPENEPVDEMFSDAVSSPSFLRGDFSEVRAMALEELLASGNPNAITSLLMLMRRQRRQMMPEPWRLGGNGDEPFQVASRLLVSGRGEFVLRALHEEADERILIRLIDVIEQDCLRKLRPDDGALIFESKKPDIAAATALVDSVCEQLEDLGIGRATGVASRVDEAVKELRLSRDLAAHNLATNTEMGSDGKEGRADLLERFQSLRLDWDNLNGFERKTRVEALLGGCTDRLSFREVKRHVPFTLTKNKKRFRLDDDNTKVDVGVEWTVVEDNTVPQWLDGLERHYRGALSRNAARETRGMFWRLNHPFDESVRERAFESLLNLARQRNAPFYWAEVGVSYRLAGICRTIVREWVKIKRSTENALRRSGSRISFAAVRCSAWSMNVVLLLRSVVLVRTMLLTIAYPSERNSREGIRRSIGASTMQSLRSWFVKKIHNAAISFLAGLGTEESVGCLVALTKDPDDTDIARVGAALAAINHPVAIECFEDLAYRQHRVTACAFRPS